MDERTEALRRRLSSTAANERRGAGQELAGLAPTNPELALALVMASLPKESDELALFYLLQALCRIEGYDRDVLQTVVSNAALTLADAPWYTGLLLVLLGRLAREDLGTVMRMLRNGPAEWPPDGGALHRELLARAWWQCAELDTSTSAAEELGRLAQPAMEGLHDEFFVFAIRAAAVAALGLACISPPEIGKGAQLEACFYSLGEVPYLFLPMDQFLKQHSEALVPRLSDSGFKGLCLRAIQAHSEHMAHPVRRVLSQMQWTAASDLVEVLAWLGHSSDTPDAALRELPSGWARLQAGRLMLEAGCSSPDFINAVKTECDDHAHGGLANAIVAREDCLAALVAHEPDPVDYYRKLRDGSPHSVWPSANAKVLARVTDLKPAQLPTLLDLHLREPHDLAALYEWSRVVTAWQCVTIGQAVTHSFGAASLTRDEAKELSDGVVAALATSDNTPVSAEWRAAWEGVAGGDGQSHHDSAASGQSLFSAAHGVTYGLLALLSKCDNAQDVAEWLGSNRAAWIECERFGIADNGALSHRFGLNSNPLTLVFPTVRVALAMRHWNDDDPITIWSRARAGVAKCIGRHWLALGPHSEPGGKDLKAAIEELKELLRSAWWDVRLLDALCLSYLRQEEPEAALEVLGNYDRLVSAESRVRAGAAYNMACAYAQQEDEDRAHEHLGTAISLGWRNADWLEQDPDFGAFRAQPWFIDAVSRLRNDGAPQT
jgi:hypothetical protein